MGVHERVGKPRESCEFGDFPEGMKQCCRRGGTQELMDYCAYSAADEVAVMLAAKACGGVDGGGVQDPCCVRCAYISDHRRWCDRNI
jgi:hypothetical protein